MYLVVSVNHTGLDVGEPQQVMSNCLEISQERHKVYGTVPRLPYCYLSYTKDRSTTSFRPYPSSVYCLFTSCNTNHVSLRTRVPRSFGSPSHIPGWAPEVPPNRSSLIRTESERPTHSQSHFFVQQGSCLL